jgi:hypothetical protein
MRQTKAILTKHVGFRLRPSALEQIQLLADKAGKQVNDWCREVVLQYAKGATPSPTEFAVIAEIAATQTIVIEMFCAVGGGGKITTQKAQEIVDKADSKKYKDAVDILRLAQAKAARFRSEGAISAERQGRAEHRD